MNSEKSNPEKKALTLNKTTLKNLRVQASVRAGQRARTGASDCECHTGLQTCA